MASVSKECCGKERLTFEAPQFQHRGNRRVRAAARTTYPANESANIATMIATLIERGLERILAIIRAIGRRPS
jgi:hypothetical protein